METETEIENPPLIISLDPGTKNLGYFVGMGRYKVSGSFSFNPLVVSHEKLASTDTDMAAVAREISNVVYHRFGSLISAATTHNNTVPGRRVCDSKPFTVTVLVEKQRGNGESFRLNSYLEGMLISSMVESWRFWAVDWPMLPIVCKSLTTKHGGFVIGLPQTYPITSKSLVERFLARALNVFLPCLRCKNGPLCKCSHFEHLTLVLNTAINSDEAQDFISLSPPHISKVLVNKKDATFQLLKFITESILYDELGRDAWCKLLRATGIQDQDSTFTTLVEFKSFLEKLPLCVPENVHAADAVLLALSYSFRNHDK